MILFACSAVQGQGRGGASLAVLRQAAALLQAASGMDVWFLALVFSLSWRVRAICPVLSYYPTV